MTTTHLPSRIRRRSVPSDNMVRGGHDQEALRFLKRTRKMSRQEALLEVAKIRMRLGMV